MIQYCSHCDAEVLSDVSCEIQHHSKTGHNAWTDPKDKVTSLFNLSFVEVISSHKGIIR